MKSNFSQVFSNGVYRLVVPVLEFLGVAVPVLVDRHRHERLGQPHQLLRHFQVVHRLSSMACFLYDANVVGERRIRFPVVVHPEHRLKLLLCLFRQIVRRIHDECQVRQPLRAFRIRPVVVQPADLHQIVPLVQKQHWNIVPYGEIQRPVLAVASEVVLGGERPDTRFRAVVDRRHPPDEIRVVPEIRYVRNAHSTLFPFLVLFGRPAAECRLFCVIIRLPCEKRLE